MNKGPKKIQDYEKLAKVVLMQLKKDPVRRVSLLKRVIQACGSPARFNGTFNWLKTTGRICKVGAGHMDAYQITWKGRQFLAGLIAEEKDNEHHS